MTTLEEVREAVDQAVLAIKMYRIQNPDPDSNASLNALKDDIYFEVIINKLRESYVLGTAGSPCPYCKGSGKIEK